MATTEQMDRMYRTQRYYYDFTRKYYLFGRDQLLDEMELNGNDRVLEIGCGTARNLLYLAEKRKDLYFYGLDASTAMLNTAQVQVKNAGQERRIILKHCMAEQLDYQGTFGLKGPFDVAFFSYSLSMIPTWSEAISACLANLKKGGCMYIVDFWDLAGYSVFYRTMINVWLSMFHVHFRPELMAHMEELHKSGIGTLSVTPVGKRYAYIAKFTKNM